jgi:hypothetical protein
LIDRTALRDVADTMETCKVWFDGQKVAYTAADLIEMAKMVLRRDRELDDASKRAAWEIAHGIGDQQDA